MSKLINVQRVHLRFGGVYHEGFENHAYGKMLLDIIEKVATNPEFSAEFKGVRYDILETLVVSTLVSVYDIFGGCRPIYSEATKLNIKREASQPT